MMLFRRNGGAPEPLPPIAFSVSGEGYTDLANADPDILQMLGFEVAPDQPPFDPRTETVVWDETSSAWIVEALPPPPAIDPTPLRVTKADFQRLLKPVERYALNALQKLIAAIPPEEYSDPSNALLVAAEDVMFAFEQPLEFIELDHPDTAQGLGLLAYLDVIEPERIAEIVANQPPA